MADTENQDVIQAEETASASSDTEQTDVTETEEVESEESAASEETESDGERIPRSRFNQAIEKERVRIRELEQQIEGLQKQSNLTPEDRAKMDQLDSVKAQLKELGFMTKDEFEAERRQAKENEYVQSELSRLEKEWSGKDGRPKFDRQAVVQFALENKIGDPEAAFYKMNMKQIIDWHNRSASEKSKGIKTEVSDGSGSSQAGTSSEDLKAAIKQGDKNALQTLLKRQL